MVNSLQSLGITWNYRYREFRYERNWSNLSNRKNKNNKISKISNGNKIQAIIPYQKYEKIGDVQSTFNNIKNHKSIKSNKKLFSSSLFSFSQNEDVFLTSNPLQSALSLSFPLSYFTELGCWNRIISRKSLVCIFQRHSSLFLCIYYLVS